MDLCLKFKYFNETSNIIIYDSDKIIGEIKIDYEYENLCFKYNLHKLDDIVISFGQKTLIHDIHKLDSLKLKYIFTSGINYLIAHHITIGYKQKFLNILSEIL